MRIRVFKILSIFSVFLFSFSSVSAFDSLDIVINEIAWMGDESPYNEWIELFNTTNKEINIAGWQIENAKSKNETLTIPAGKIPASEYFLICRKEIGNCDLIESKLSLHNEYNENGKLVLKATTGSIIDTTPETGNKQWPAGNNETKQTMERKNSLDSGNDSSNWQLSQNSGGTPKMENSQEEEIKKEPIIEKIKQSESESLKVDYPSDVYINEVLPSPEGFDAENEWTVPTITLKHLVYSQLPMSSRGKK